MSQVTRHRWETLPAPLRAVVAAEKRRRDAAPKTWAEWRARRDLVCKRLARIIRNTARFSDETFRLLLERIDDETDHLRDTSGLGDA